MVFATAKKSINGGIWIVIIVLTGYLKISECNTISTTTEAEYAYGKGIEDEDEDSICHNDFPNDFCADLVESEGCFDEKSMDGSAYGEGCRKSCGFCDDTEMWTQTNDNEVLDITDRYLMSTDNDDDNFDDGVDGKCEDKMPDCSKYLAVCCSMKDAMNVSCPKTCRFCTETPSPGVAPGAPVPTGSTNQDPCGSTNPPSVTIDTPGQTTTTTLSPGTAPAVTLPPTG